jgi:chemotaxis protein MotB
MKRNQFKAGFFALLIVLLLVFPSMLVYAGGAKVKELEGKLDKCNDQVADLEAKNSQLQSNNENLEAEISSLESQRSDLQREIRELEAKLSSAETRIAILESEAPDPMIVAKTIEQKIQEKEAEIIELKMERDELESEVQQINREIARLKSENRTIKTQNERLTRQVAALEDENEELEMTLEVYEGIQKESLELSDLILERINELLYDEIREGKVRVFKGTLGVVLDIVSEDMFDVGSVEVNRQGREILNKLGTLLRELDGYLIGVIGNADNKPIVTPSLKRKFPTNWELSAARGAAITRYLIDISRTSPSRFISMGLGEYQPIDTNRTIQGRGNNRRVDIVLLPLDVLAAVVVGAEVK